MKDIDKHNTPKHSPDKGQNFFGQLEVPYPKDKEAVWEQLAQQLHPPAAQQPTIKRLWAKIAVAAVFVLAASLSFLRFYTTTVDCPLGKHLTHTLPDGSSVQLNAASSIHYAPFWWSFSRQLSLEGEAFFDVEKGSRFTVKSALGQTEVLGTSFNIFSRNSHYQVLCKTGKVKVSVNKQSVILRPNEQVRLAQQQLLKQAANTDKVLGWTANKFHFEATSLPLVLNEIERQYNVDIIFDHQQLQPLSYTGYFSKTSEVENSLELICISFNLKFVKEEKNKYQIIPN